ncbi:hypothetical protein N7470_006304 [Penicillium chermesinum]|nr:hypothetical protein N7470_006304 [Penicillium chermesinum]
MSDSEGAHARADSGDKTTSAPASPGKIAKLETSPQADEQHQDPQPGNENGGGTPNHDGETEQVEETAPPLPDEAPPPLPDEAPPENPDDDGWEPVWEPNTQAYYFYNRFTQASQWENPRVPTATAPGTVNANIHNHEPAKKPVAGGYNPAIHGDYDPTADYAQSYEDYEDQNRPAVDPAAAYEAVGTFNRFTGRWQASSINPDNHNDENKARRQMNAFFDVDAAANSHDGRSLRAERSNKRLSKKELKAFKEKRREKKEEKRRAWLLD